MGCVEKIEVSSMEENFTGVRRQSRVFIVQEHTQPREEGIHMIRCYAVVREKERVLAEFKVLRIGKIDLTADRTKRKYRR